MEARRRVDVLMARWFYELVTTWRRMVRLVAEAAQSLYPGARVYVIGGAAENRLTAVSDVDVLLVLPWEPGPRERLRVKIRVMEEAFRRGLPLDYPHRSPCRWAQELGDLQAVCPEACTD